MCIYSVRRFLECSESRDPARADAYLFDAHFGLRVAQQHGKMSACIHLMIGLNMLVDAVQLAASYTERQAVIRHVRCCFQNTVVVIIQGLVPRVHSNSNTMTWHVLACLVHQS